MVTMNPFKWTKGLYSKDNQAVYARYLSWGIEDVEQKLMDSVREKCGDDSTSPNKDKLTYMNSNMESRSNTDPSTKQAKSYGSYYSKLGLEPHVFETVSLAFSGLVSVQQNQTILVSGESGAGKTETVKIVMTNLATLEQTRPSYTLKNDASKGRDNKRREEGPHSIVQRVLESNPLFESFGNAKVSIVY